MSSSSEVVERLRGPVQPLPICFRSDGSVDYEAVARYVDWLCEHRAPVLLLTSGTSEFAYLSDDEVLRLTAKIAEVNAGRSLFISATKYWKPTVCHEFLLEAHAAGADAVKVQVSAEYPSDRDSYLEYFERIGERTEIPLLLLDPPASVRDELAGRPNIVGAKVHDLMGYFEYTRSTRDEEFAVVSAGQMKSIIFGHQLGSPAYLCPIVGIAPEIALDFWRKIEAREYVDAWDTVLRYEDPIIQAAHDVHWPQLVKTSLHLLGHYPNDLLAPPQRRSTPQDVERVRQVLEETFGGLDGISV